MKKIRINGIVQGVGFRPFVYRLAKEIGIRGYVLNSSSGVKIIADSEEDKIAEFIERLRREKPPASKIKLFEVEDIPYKKYSDFYIKKSAKQKGTTLISPDLAVCKDCVREMFDENDKRYLYPFINCTNCGPRFSIIESTPYDRPVTSMKEFKMCDFCESEYQEPLNRRFHAQPIACPECGPEFILLKKDLSKINVSNPIKKAVCLLKQGNIIGIKGIGGFHLACDAANDKAVERLRSLKKRPLKPFAVMSRKKDLSRLVKIKDKDLELVSEPSAPILILPRQSDPEISALIAPNNPNLGVFIPYAPIHYLLFDDELPFLIMTSGNISHQPISSNAQALTGICDYFLTNNRPILNRSDDSVILPTKYKNLILRRSRGFVPSPIKAGKKLAQTLGTGAELKLTFALSKGDSIYLSPYIGNSSSQSTLNFYQEMLAKYKKWFGIEPELIACDLQPDFATTRFAESQKLPLVRVQHHHAHTAAVMVENKLDEPVISISYDGTGYGTDGAIWGGEIFVADYSKCERKYHLNYMPLPGGDAAIKKPVRIAYAYLDKINEDTALVENITKLERKIISKQISNNFNIFKTSSLGRLFDCVSTMLGLFPEITFEAQSAMALQFLCNEKNVLTADIYPYIVENEQINIVPMLKAIIKDLKNRIKKSTIAESFHRTIIDFTLTALRRISSATDIDKVVLSGGVMQNKIIVEGLCHILQKNNFTVFLPSSLPTNDGSISVGQIMVANHIMKDDL